jgi:hypothetical protein
MSVPPFEASLERNQQIGQFSHNHCTPEAVLVNVLLPVRARADPDDSVVLLFEAPS